VRVTVQPLRPAPDRSAVRAGATREGQRRDWGVAAVIALLGCAAAVTARAADDPAGTPGTLAEGPIDFPAYEVVGDAIPAPLTATRGNATRGRALVGNRQQGLCLLCHAGPFPDAHLQGTLAPPLAGAGARWNEGQLRLRLVDPQRVNPDSIMPAYGAPAGRERVGNPWRGRPVLSPQQIEDVVAYLRTLDRPAAGSSPP
jgi:L-cysteine S-thiosulfotransferase